MNLLDIEVRNIRGETRPLTEFKGKALLIVNVASGCGFTPQYKGLEALYRRYQDRGFAVLGFPCNQFLNQEPGTEAEIQSFCFSMFDVTFPLFSKVQVNGASAHPLFNELKKAAPGILGTEAIKWNFTKFLVDPSGKVIARYSPREEPESIAPDIEKVLPR